MHYEISVLQRQIFWKELEIKFIKLYACTYPIIAFIVEKQRASGFPDFEDIANFLFIVHTVLYKEYSIKQKKLRNSSRKVLK